MKKNGKKSVIQEFKQFISRGKVLDLAVGVIIGSAFTAIVTSLNKDVIMPLIGACMGGKDFKGLRIPLWNAEKVIDEATGLVVIDDFGQELYTSAIYYGRFLQAIIDFLLVAIIIFTIVKTINTIRTKAEKAREKLIKKEQDEIQKVVPTPVPEDIKLLTEIRDLLANKNKEN